ncbi:hypothetical protein [Mucilaginibacter paludis]|uniref:Uncharacterized protein n=1 Tax=Mucilaginibacter paludis DSM 18603 TaxID=714943 RepID=H1Y3K3_9SPHI|nr:hypothetical protein [Mucilaginibacter paludis]EHQ29771.1 hypothetical protein Mucpa_5702 [Mucilaginibacter paludis DSM 18603]
MGVDHPQVEEKEVGLTTSDGEYQLWESFPVVETRSSDLKTIEGGNLNEWIKSHPLNFNFDKSSNEPKTQYQPD